MLISRIKNFISGIVAIKISGKSPEKLINLCLIEHILLWDIHKSDDVLYAKIRLRDFLNIRSIVRKSNCKVTVIRFFGLPFLIKRLKQRRMLAIGAILFVVFLNLLGSYIWVVDVTGTKNGLDAKIKEIAYEKGLKTGIQKDTLDLRKVEKDLLASMPELTWVSISYYGTRAVIDVVEKSLPKPEDKRPANLVATKDCQIMEVVVVSGTQSVKNGDIVHKGDVLIKGILSPGNNTEQSSVQEQPAVPVRAAGIIKGKVWYEGYGEAEMNKTDYTRTGTTTIGVEVDWKGRKYVLKDTTDLPFDIYEVEELHKKLPLWRNSDVAVETIIKIYRELAADTYKISHDDAREIAKARALNAVQGLIPETACILARNIEVLNTSETNLVRVKVAVETLEDIAEVDPIEN